jgi:aspartate dehydrogenase
MQTLKKKIKIGIVGCGAIGSRLGKSVKKELKGLCEVTALFDIDPAKSENLARVCAKPGSVKKTLEQLLKSCDLMVEAVNAEHTETIIRKALQARKDVLVMSVGKLLEAKNLFPLAAKHGCTLLIPSGAIAGIDAVKAASLGTIDKITITSRKPPFGFSNAPYVKERGIDLSRIDKETVLFEGDVQTAVKLFPQNINVGATLALASQAPQKLTIRIVASPDATTNSHEIEVTGDFGRITSRTDNAVCPDNPKTSYLAVLSAIQSLKEYCLGTHVGT